MLRRPLLNLVLALVLGVLFAGGLARLFMLRYETGDIYPAYSSLRADPLGTKALAAALDDLPGVEVQRNFKPLTKLRPQGPVTLVYAGVKHRSFWTDKELLEFDSLVAGGSRAVFTFFPVERPPSKYEDKRAGEDERKKKEEQTEDEKGDEKRTSRDPQKPKTDKPGNDKVRNEKPADKGKDTKGEPPEDETSAESLISFETAAKHWGFGFDYLPEEKGKAYYRHAALVEPGGHLESDISWHTALYFRDLKPQWKVLYMCGMMPVIIERKYGNGSIILVADSFLVSNEALRGERHSHLLARLFSGPSPIVFDEEHNGLRDNPGVASLARKYRLHGVVAGLLLLAILFVWKNVVRFVPPYRADAAENDVIAGKESGEGFINLLRRTIAPSAILEACMSEWRKAFIHKPRDRAKAEEAWAGQQLRPPHERDPISTYRAVSRALARKV